MPATEQTWRDQKKLHFIFAISSVIMLLTTIWMFTRDSNRQWKIFQGKSREIMARTILWQEDEFLFADYLAEHGRLETDLAESRGMPLDTELVKEFKAELERDAQERSTEPPTSLWRDDIGLVERHEKVTEKATYAKQKHNTAQFAADKAGDQQAALKQQLIEAETTATSASEDELESAQKVVENLEGRVKEATDAKVAADKNLQLAEQKRIDAVLAVAPIRDDLVTALDALIQRSRFRENTAAHDRKFKGADLDKSKADLGLGVRDGLSDQVLRQRQATVDSVQSEFDVLTRAYEARMAHRKELASLLSKIIAGETEALKKLSDHKAGEEQLATAFRETRATWTVYGFLPGKKFLQLPILDAFGSPLKIENHWSEGLTQFRNFNDVRRFDRCVTCHQAIEKSRPGSAVDPAISPERTILFTLPTAEPIDDADIPHTENMDALERQVNRVRATYGMGLADEGLLNSDDVTVRYVRPRSFAAQARAIPALEKAVFPGEFRDAVLHDGAAQTVLDVGLLPGDVLEEINGDVVGDVRQAAYQLLVAAENGESLTLKVRRGLPQPYTSHPRLDLYIGSLSPHTLADFACTICHEGQGSATDFLWASHTPSSPRQAEAWRKEYGWFDNHHWAFPMSSRQFLQSVCLKCHHDVVELEPSARFPEPPAPKLLRGHTLIRKYGCYGCHEINGFDGPDRVGPDLRVEPNYFAAAQALKMDPGFKDLTDQEQAWIESLIDHPELDTIRRKLVTRLKTDQLDAHRLSDHAYSALLPVLGDVEHPGEFSKPGPSLRFLGSKLDPAFAYSWIWNPQDFRPTTRMPRFLGLWDHLKADHESLELTKKFEPMEAYAMAYYLRAKSQPFDYLDPPAGISESSADERLARGTVLFEERGCLACHTHKDFPDLAKYRKAGELQQGPDLSAIGDKFDPKRNPNGHRWLYSWIKKPNRYHVRTVMPDLFLGPIKHKDIEGNVTVVTDPAADITEFLLQSRTGWSADNAITQLTSSQEKDLDALAMEHLNDGYSSTEALSFLADGIERAMESTLKGAEKELIVEKKGSLSLEMKLKYVGRKSINKYGCFGCHDIPGFEEAKPIGTALADWGLKDPSKLAFEHIGQYLSHGHSEHSHGDDPAKHDHEEEVHEKVDDLPPFYEGQLMSGNRIGFLYQKLREPRGYDYHKTLNKGFNERLRMPQFPFTVEEREAVMTFVLGLVADPPSAKYIYQPDERMKAIGDGRKVLQKYNCGGCHVLEPEKWKIAYSPDQFGKQVAGSTHPFVAHQFTKEELDSSALTDSNNRLTSTIVGMPAIDADGIPVVTDLELEELYFEDKYTNRDVIYSFDLWAPVTLNGHAYQVGESALGITGDQIVDRRPSEGGLLAKYLLSRVVAREKIINTNAKGTEAWGWLPPSLFGEGRKVQTPWLHDFLLDPHMIRPSVVLRMPNFHMTSEEAEKLANYFAAVDNVAYPYQYSERRRSGYLSAMETSYRARLQSEGIDPGANDVSRRLADAMKFVTNNTYCVSCHIVGDFAPTSSVRGQGPDLAIVHKRMRPEYLRQWLAKPKSFLRYTGMPDVVPFDATKPFLGSTVPQDLYHGTSADQLEALVDLLMNYDVYANERSKIAPLVKQAAPATEDDAADATAETTEASAPN